VFHSLLLVQSATFWWVSSKCSNFTMWLVKIQKGEIFWSRCELFMGNMYSISNQRVKAINQLKWCVFNSYLECCMINIQNHVYVFIPINVVFIHQLSKQWTNDFFDRLSLSITLWLRSYALVENG
jgi:hypothetical protein